MHGQVHLDLRHVDHGGDREDYGRRDQALDRPRDHLSDRDQPDRQRGEDPILDLPRVAELLDHGKRDGLYPLEHDREPDGTGDEHGGEAGLGGAATSDRGADLRKDVEKDEHQKERLKDRPGDENAQVLAKDNEVPQELGFERRPARRDGRPGRGQPRRLAGGESRRAHGVHHSRRSFPVSLMNTVSSVGSATERSVTVKPPPSAAATT